MISQVFMNGFETGEVTCPTKCFDEAPGINFSRSVQYGPGVLGVSAINRMHMGAYQAQVVSEARSNDRVCHTDVVMY